MSTEFSALLAGIAEEDGIYAAELTDDWRQGRTAYGGLSAALSYEAAIRAENDLPPLRSAQFAFIGPASGTLRMTPSLLRRGKSSVFMSVDLEGDAGLATRSMLCFGTNRASVLDHADLPMPDVPAPSDCHSFFMPGLSPKFTEHFDGRLAGGAYPFTGSGKPEMLVWLRHAETQPLADTHPLNRTTQLIALADALPPAAMVLFPPKTGPISTMTWTVDMLSDAPFSESGWWLVRTTAETAQNGYSAQDMTAWNDQGIPALRMRQTVALFV